MLLRRLFSSTLLMRVAAEVSMWPATKTCNSRRMRYLTQAEATALDEELFNEYKFSVDQLMELAGLSVAQAVTRCYPKENYNSVLVVCGPGNNGGDGLVAARHLLLFGYDVSIYYPKRTPKPLYENLFHQCNKFGVHVVNTLPLLKEVPTRYKVMVDALFGFSFKPPVRVELKPVLDLLIDSPIPVCSVDVPSGWHVEKGPDVKPGAKALSPAMLVSLSAPKLCAVQQNLINASHFLGGRFLPAALIEKYNLTLPQYPDQDQVVQISC